VAEQSKNYRYSTAHQVVIDADTRLVVVVGRPLPGYRHDARGWEESGAKETVGTTMTIADGGHQSAMCFQGPAPADRPSPSSVIRAWYRVLPPVDAE